MIQRSFIIPVLDFSPHSPYSIETLLKDLMGIPGEVICIFNSEETFQRLHGHPRIDKYCHNKTNAGVSRSWNIGINMSEGRSVFIMNADLHVTAHCIEEMERYLFSLDKAVIVGPQGSHLDLRNLSVVRYFQKGTFHSPVRTHDVSGFLFAIYAERFLENRFVFDIRYSPCFFEEWDMGIQIMQAKLAMYAVPVTGFDHQWGMSQEDDDRIINYFGREVRRGQVMADNRIRFVQKWSDLIPFNKDLLSLASL